MEKSALPIIVESETSNLDKSSGQPAQPPASSFSAPDPNPKKLPAIVPKLVFIFLGLVILVEIILGVKTLTTPVPEIRTSNASFQVLPPQPGRIELLVEKTQFKVGEQVPVKIKVASGDHYINGVDVIIKFDPKILDEAQRPSLSTSNLFDEYPLAKVDRKNGLVQISGITSLSKKGFKGTGELATVLLKAKAAGSAVVTVEFAPGITSDSNLIEIDSSTDILESVGNINLSIIK